MNNNSNDNNNVIELSNEEESKLLARFPVDADISLCNRLPSKIQADVYQAIPVGKHAQLWYTYYNDMNVAIIITKTNGVYKLELCYACFTNDIAYGTILSGIYFSKFTQNKTCQRIFCADNISYYKGEYVNKLSMLEKLSIISNMFEYSEIGNIKPLYNSIRVCMPIMTNDYNKLQNYISTLCYPIYGIKFINYKDNKPIGNLNSKIEDLMHTNKKCVFLVKANIEPDSYTLFGKDTVNYDNNKLQRIGVALIPSYQDSIRMNTLFRRIKENMNIDSIEDSEDEDDFENVEPTKYLLPNVEYKMYCSFSNISNRWIPESIAPPDTELSSISKFQFRALNNIKGQNSVNERMNNKKERRINKYGNNSNNYNSNNYNSNNYNSNNYNSNNSNNRYNTNSNKKFSYITENNNQEFKKSFVKHYRKPYNKNSNLNVKY